MNWFVRFRPFAVSQVGRMAAALFGGLLFGLIAIVIVGARDVQADDVCDFIAGILRSGDARDLTRHSLQTRVGEYVADAPVPTSWRYPTADVFPELRSGSWEVSLVDLDNDGVPEVRFTQISGPLVCEASYFFTATGDGAYRAVYTTEPAAICDDASTIVVSYRGTNVLVFYSTFDVSVTAVAADGTAKSVCRIVRTPGRSRVVSACSHAVCGAVSERLKGWGSAERPYIETSDPELIHELVAVDAVRIRDEDFRRRFRELQGQRIDIDNDGRKEFVVLSWRGPRWGRPYWVFAEGADGFERVDPAKRWRGWPGRAEDGFLLLDMRGTTYVVALTRPEGNQLRGRLARIYLVGTDAAHEIGRVEFATEWVITIDRDPTNHEHCTNGSYRDRVAGSASPSVTERAAS